MSTDGKRKDTWIQCQECGNIYLISRQFPEDELYVVAYCSECESRIGLNLGCDENDKYYFMNPNLDRRLF